MTKIDALDKVCNGSGFTVLLEVFVGGGVGCTSRAELEFFVPKAFKQVVLSPTSERGPFSCQLCENKGGVGAQIALVEFVRLNGGTLLDALRVLGERRQLALQIQYQLKPVGPSGCRSSCCQESRVAHSG